MSSCPAGGVDNAWKDTKLGGLQLESKTCHDNPGNSKTLAIWREGVCRDKTLLTHPSGCRS